MARPTRKNRFEFEGRLLAHPSVFDNANGSKTVLMHVATDSDYNAETKQFDYDDVELRAYVPAERIGKDNRLWAVKGSHVAGTARWNSYRKTNPDGSVTTTRTMDISEFELYDTAAETNARLAKYASQGDQVAATILAQRQGQIAPQVTAAQAQAPQVQNQAAPQAGNAVNSDPFDDVVAAATGQAQASQAPAMPMQAQVQAQSAPQVGGNAVNSDPFGAVIAAAQGQATPAPQATPAAAEGTLADSPWAGEQSAPAPEWFTA